MSELPPDLVFLQWLIDECGYLSPKPLPGGRYAAIYPKAYTHAIVTARIGDHYGIDTSWCYSARAEAKAALDAWDGSGEPTGWIRHPDSGRRVSQSADEYNEDGGQVGAVGVMYVRW
jgi:hypothetical protein